MNSWFSVFSLFGRSRSGNPAQVSEPIRSIEGWGHAYDPIGDCQFETAESWLTIAVPGTLHDLSAEQGQTSAPRVLREVDGDFVARVRVEGALGPGGAPTCSYAYPYLGAGLLFWRDDRDYVRLERAAIRRGTQVISYVNFERRRRGRLVHSEAAPIPEAPQILRLERQGHRLFASFSPDGDCWTPLPEMAIDFGSSLRIGVAAVNTSTNPFRAVFESLEVAGVQVAQGLS